MQNVLISSASEPPTRFNQPTQNKFFYAPKIIGNKNNRTFKQVTVNWLATQIPEA